MGTGLFAGLRWELMGRRVRQTAGLLCEGPVRPRTVGPQIGTIVTVGSAHSPWGGELPRRSRLSGIHSIELAWLEIIIRLWCCVCCKSFPSLSVLPRFTNR